MLALRFLLMILPGAFLAWTLLSRVSRGGALLDALAFGPLLGCGLVTSLDLGARLLLERPLALLELALVAGLVALAAIPLALSRPRCEGPAEDSGPGLRLVALLILGASATFAAGVFAVRSSAAPDGGWDGMAVWGLLGRILHGSGGDPRLALATIDLTQTDYPLLLPGSLAILHDAAGFDSPLPGQVMAWLGFISLPLIAHRLLVRLAGPAVAHLGALLLLCTPAFLLRASEQYADVLLAALNLAAVGLAALALRGGPGRGRLLVLAGLLLGLLPWTKAEGLVLALVILGAALAALRGSRGRPRLTLVAALLPGLAVAIAFLVLVAPRERRLESSLGGALENLFDLERWQAAVAGFGQELKTVLPFPEVDSFDPARQRWGFYFGAVVLIVLVRLGRGFLDRPRRFVLAVALLQLGAYAAIFALIPERQHWQIDNALHRLLLQVAPLFVLIALGRSQAEHEAAEPGNGETRSAAHRPSSC